MLALMVARLFDVEQKCWFDSEHEQNYSTYITHHASRITPRPNERILMRTTLNIDDDVLITAQFLARKDQKTLGQVISELARNSLRGTELDATPGAGANLGEMSPLDKKLAELGLVPFKAGKGRPVANDTVDAIRDAEGI
jgi:hypothetical protein